MTAFPTRIDFSVTERCDLRCQHCITFAPERTARGTARTMSPWVLDRLRSALGFASYFGFVHGGESLTTPMLFEALRAIREERGIESTTVHLLTNGVLLVPDAAERLVEHGVSSISVSLDGATEATNDAVRVGGRFQSIVKNLRAAVELRRRARLDLRLGLSFVILESNVQELEAFVALAADVGVDWLKLEEAVPVNPYAERSLVARSRAELDAAIAVAVARGRAHGLVVVDHTAERPLWRCRLHEDSSMRAFVEADEFANRSEIHPCRAPWEVACVEPNGDVRAGHFFGPVLGNVMNDDLRALWNGERAREERRRSHAARLCGPAGDAVDRTGPAADACVVARAPR